MKKTLFTAASITLSASTAYAGGMERTTQSISPLFEKGTYLELGVYHNTPSISGSLGSLKSGNVANDFSQFDGAFKYDVTNDLSMAIIIDQPFGAHLSYPKGKSYPLSGTTAKVESVEIAGIVRYKINRPVSIYAGVRNLTSKGKVTLPVYGYDMKTDTQHDWGYLAGVSYENPDLALRASLTYNSSIKIDFHDQENLAAPATHIDTRLDVDMPQSVNFNFQTGLTPTTLLLFSARWVKWTKTKITPEFYTAFVDRGNNLVDYSNDTISYRLGVAQRLTDRLSGAISLAYEKSSGDVVSNLSPTDGYKAILAGVKYQVTQKTALSSGISYAWIGDSKTNLGGNEAHFDDSHALGLALKVSHHF